MIPKAHLNYVDNQFVVDLFDGTPRLPGLWSLLEKGCCVRTLPSNKMALVDYGSSSDSDSEKPVKKRQKTVFIIPKKHAEEAFESKLLPENSGILNALPKPKQANPDGFEPRLNPSKIAEKQEILNDIEKKSQTFEPEKNVDDDEKGDENADEEKGFVENDEKEDEEVFDFFSISGLKEKKTETLIESAPIQGPSKPNYILAKNNVAHNELPLSDSVKKAPFVFKPIEKAVQKHQSNSSIISAKDFKLFSSSSIKTISHSDLLGASEERARKRQLQDAAKQSKHLIDDPFEKLEGSYIATSASSRTNSIMQMAYKAKEEYFDRIERKAEQKAVKRIVRQKYGF